ncbi:unnamed protein product [Dovyalis caffra]|uniref:Acid phosphatase/vanadium-dependent haloperoxidase-related protein n=1 Tax=Dovyalis caffra TaxID=77055 RepID=A0AAV1QY82_9ROSI|nr:unnamed protein product [Dovyalis caffra]
MVFQCWTSASNLASPNLSTVLSDSRSYPLTRFRKPRRPTKLTCLLKLGVEDIADIVHNKVLLAAGASAAIGQLSKPFTSILLYGKDFDFKTAFQPGGFPSTHSSSVVAAATSLALERGFSDSIFGLTVVYAGLVMYDAQVTEVSAQALTGVGRGSTKCDDGLRSDLEILFCCPDSEKGVRREVGNHAKELNKVLSKTEVNSMVSSLNESQQATEEKLGPLLSKGGRPFLPNSTNSPILLETESKTTQTSQIPVSSSLAGTEEAREKVPYSSASPLKESIGHTEVEVIAGALLGFFVSLILTSTARLVVPSHNIAGSHAAEQIGIFDGISGM